MRVHHRGGSYEVLFASAREVFDAIRPEHFVITDENVSRLWGHGLAAKTLVLPAGEETKSICEFEHACRWLAEHGASRKSLVVAFGGGVIGDLAGFVASAYMRGVPLLQVPTTLLAQVDSSVGGKVGIDLPEGKNLVGAFYPPSEVIVSPEFLSTLDDREFRNGAAEVWKYGAILDPNLLADLESSPLDQAMLASEEGRLRCTDIIRRCIELKQSVVERDEFETTGLRAILNFGHTVGHAIEKEQAYRGLKHGEAISVGMVVECRLGEALGITSVGLGSRLEHGLASQGLPTRLPKDLQAASLLDAMRLDKKAWDGNLAFSLLEDAGACKLVQDVPESCVLEVLETCLD